MRGKDKEREYTPTLYQEKPLRSFRCYGQTLPTQALPFMHSHFGGIFSVCDIDL